MEQLKAEAAQSAARQHQLQGLHATQVAELQAGTDHLKRELQMTLTKAKRADEAEFRVRFLKPLCVAGVWTVPVAGCGYVAAGCGVEVLTDGKRCFCVVMGIELVAGRKGRNGVRSSQEQRNACPRVAEARSGEFVHRQSRSRVSVARSCRTGTRLGRQS